MRGRTAARDAGRELEGTALSSNSLGVGRAPTCSARAKKGREDAVKSAPPPVVISGREPSPGGRGSVSGGTFVNQEYPAGLLRPSPQGAGTGKKSAAPFCSAREHRFFGQSGARLWKVLPARPRFFICQLLIVALANFSCADYCIIEGVEGS